MSDTPLRERIKTTLEKEKEKAESQLERAREKIEKAEARIAEFQAEIEKNNVYFIADNNKYATNDIDPKGNIVWTFITAEASAKLFNLVTAEDKRIFDGVLRELNRIKLRSVNSFNSQPDNVLNLMSQEGWIEPMSGDYDPVFDVLMNSLSGGRQNVRDHIEKVLVYKYLHPECYKLPCITISGEGGVGKNEFVEQVLATVFGKQQIAVVGTEEAFGQFNGQMLGKTIVFIDEALSDKTNAENLKRKVGNETLQINMKYGIQGTFDNTPWYWLGGNGTNGAVMLAGDMTDRRYSVITVKHSVMHWVAKHLDLDITVNGVLRDDHPCVQWYVEHAQALSDRQEVAKWFGSICVKWAKQTSPPSALHADDYKNVLSIQKSVMDEVIDNVFGDTAFTHIEAKTLYTMYKLTIRSDNPSARAKGRNTFLEDVKRLVEKRYPNVRYDKVNVMSMSKKSSAWVFIADDKKTVKRNTDYYVVEDSKGHETVVERDAPVEDDDNLLS